jgi:hypothetical protein
MFSGNEPWVGPEILERLGGKAQFVTPMSRFESPVVRDGENPFLVKIPARSSNASARLAPALLI